LSACAPWVDLHVSIALVHANLHCKVHGGKTRLLSDSDGDAESRQEDGLARCRGATSGGGTLAVAGDTGAEQDAESV
jgi:hypothetical protein